MVGDVLNWSLSRARCFASGLCVFPGDEGGGAFSRLLRVKKVSQGQSGREIWRRSCD